MAGGPFRNARFRKRDKLLFKARRLFRRLKDASKKITHLKDDLIHSSLLRRALSLRRRSTQLLVRRRSFSLRPCKSDLKSSSLGSSDDHTDSDADDEAELELDSSALTSNDTSPAHSQSAIRFRIDAVSSERSAIATSTSPTNESVPVRATAPADAQEQEQEEEREHRSLRQRFSLSKREIRRQLYERFERLFRRDSRLSHSRTQPQLLRLSSETDSLLTELAAATDSPDECVSFDGLPATALGSGSGVGIGNLVGSGPVPEHLGIIFKSIR